MASQPIPFATPEEYLELEHESAIKHEYLDGEIVALAGTSFRHNLITRNLVRILVDQVRKTPCSEFGSDLRVAIPSHRLFCYPDMTIACPPFDLIPGMTDTLVNPTFLIEVLSRSTRAHDRGYKLPLYREIPSLAGYLFIDQYKVSVEYGHRVSGNQWQVHLITDPNVVLDLVPIQCKVPIASLYEDLDYDI